MTEPALKAPVPINDRTAALVALSDAPGYFLVVRGEDDELSFYHEGRISDLYQFIGVLIAHSVGYTVVHGTES